jgi:hypothetical protein
MFDAGNASGFHAAAIHQQRVELDAPIGGEEAASPSIERGVILEHDNSRLDRIECGASMGEDRVSGFQGLADAVLMRGLVRWRNGPGAPMNQESRNARGARDHVPMVVHSATNDPFDKFRTGSPRRGRNF